MKAQVTFHGIEPSTTIEAEIDEQVRRLQLLCERITACKVAVEAPHRHHRKGRHFRVRIEVSIPGKEIVVGKDPSDAASHADAYVALRDGFEATRRKLQEFLGRRRAATRAGTLRRRSGPARAGR